MKLNDKEKDLIIHALNMRKNYIETEDISFSAEDMIRMGPTVARELKMHLKELSLSQKGILRDIAALIEKLNLNKRHER